MSNEGLMTEAYPGELEELRKIRSIVRHIGLAEKLGDIYFISGEMGSKDLNGLPEALLICPAYGLDWSQIYTKTEKTTGPEW